MSTALYLGIGGGVLLLIIIIAFVMMSGDKKDKKDESTDKKDESIDKKDESTDKTSSTPSAKTNTDGETNRLNIPRANDNYDKNICLKILKGGGTSYPFLAENCPDWTNIGWDQYGVIKGSSIPLPEHKKFCFGGNVGGNSGLMIPQETCNMNTWGWPENNFEAYLKTTPGEGYKKWCYGYDKDGTKSMALIMDNCNDLKNIGWEVKGEFYSK